ILVAASALVGLLLGITGVGAGALMTPMLVLLFGVAPSAAISADLLATLVMRPVGAAVHWRRGTIRRDIVGPLSLGALPAAFLGTFVMHLMGTSGTAEVDLTRVLGAALVLGAAAMTARQLHVVPVWRERANRTALTVTVGAVGGFMVGLTSVGAGSLVMVLLVVLYPTLGTSELIGTDLAQSIPLALSASVGTLLFAHVDWNLTLAVVIGGVPAIFVGSLIATRANSPLIRHLMIGLVGLSGLKYLGLSIVLVGLAGLAALFVYALTTASRRRARNFEAASQ
ncbi:MAG TPA: sulfite exporter TauE/SafE family protein, partial [Acidimicrobiales bacterium]|nr:sulfite exporter TauE/SafE family protein [Acidimicrobiales bacterium]